MSSSQILGSGDVSSVAEMAVEPSYISEIARKLQEVGPPYSDMSLNVVIRIVSRSAYAMAEEGRLRVERPPLGGQVESSPKTSLVGDGFAETDRWREYTVVQSNTDIGEVRDEYVEFIDTDVTMDQKLEVVRFLSSAGNQISKDAERILQDQVEVFDYDYIEKSEYTDPGLDVYIEVDGTGYGIEISTRWVNPISGNYVNSKLTEVAEMEEERGVPVNLLVMAPTFTGREKRNRRDSDIVSLERLPRGGDGNPVIITDFTPTSDETGPEYPVVDEAYETLQDDLDDVMRPYNVVEEAEYRSQITDIVGGFL